MTHAMVQNVEAIEGSDFDPIGTITYPITQFILVIDNEGLGQNDYKVNFCAIINSKAGGVRYCSRWRVLSVKTIYFQF